MEYFYRDVLYSRVARARDQAQAKERVKPGVLVLVVPHKKPKSLRFLCPCGCGETVAVNLLPGLEKAWTFEYRRGEGISLWPSVWLSTGCRSHFILRNNKARLLLGRPRRTSSLETDRWRPDEPSGHA
jgi:hypothetical protein